MKILITGDSHVGPLQRGIDLLRREKAACLDAAEVVVRPLGGGHLLPMPFFKMKGGRIEITQPEYRTRMERYPPPDVADADFHGISAPLHTARVFRHEQWRDYALAGEAEGIPVSDALLARLVDDDQRQVMAFFKALVALGLRPFAIEGPRPFRHHPAVAVLGAPKVLRIDRFYRERMRAWLAAEGIAQVDIPPELMDADGFMLETMSKDASDAHHGNERFGARMVARIVDQLTIVARR